MREIFKPKIKWLLEPLVCYVRVGTRLKALDFQLLSVTPGLLWYLGWGSNEIVIEALAMRSVLYRMHFSLEPRLLFCIPGIWSMIASEHAKQNTYQRTDMLSTAQTTLTPQRRQEHICVLCLLPPWITISIYFFFFSLWNLSIGICATSSLSTWPNLSLTWEERTSTEKSTQPDWLEDISMDSFSWLYINTEKPNPLGCWAGWSRAVKERLLSKSEEASQQAEFLPCLLNFLLWLPLKMSL